MSSTRATTLLGIDHPIVQAGMAYGFTNAELVATVSGAGGLGVLGCLNRPAEEAVADVRRIRSLTDRPFGVNFVVQHLDQATFEACLDERVPVFTFFRGAPAIVVERARASGALTAYQVTTAAEAEAAVEAGVDVLIAQGLEAGGHVGAIPLSEVLPTVIAVAGGRPVLAAGGIVEGRDLAEVLQAGADGASIGTRFLATPESPAPAGHKRAILDAGEGATVRTGVWDLIWGRAWPGVEVRTLRNAITERWIGRNEEIAARRDEISAGIAAALDRDDPTEYDLLAGEGSNRIASIQPAADLVREVAAEAERILGRLRRLP